MTTTIGIDPGLDGAIAVLVDGELADVIDTPTYQTKQANGKKKRHVDCAALETILRATRAHCDPHTNPSIAIETPQPRPGNGAHSAFSSGVSWGGMIELTRHLGWVVTYARPQDWRKGIGFDGDKDDARYLAAALWPEMADVFARKKDDGRAEAALIAHWRETT